MISATPPGPLAAITSASFAAVLALLVDRPTPLVVGIGGPGGSGKSSLAAWLRTQLVGARILALDDFRLPRHQRPAHARFGSHPEANDRPAILQALADYRAGRPVCQPIFDRDHGAARHSIRELVPGPLLLDGEICAHAWLRAQLDELILVEAHWRTLLDTRLRRDISQRACDIEKVFDIFLHSNLRDYPQHAADARQHASAILHRRADGVVTLRRQRHTDCPSRPGRP